PLDRARHDARSGSAVPRRALRRPRSADAPPVMGDHPRLQPAGQNDRAHHALHGRGRRPMWAAGDRRSWKEDRGRHARGAQVFDPRRFPAATAIQPRRRGDLRADPRHARRDRSASQGRYQRGRICRLRRPADRSDRDRRAGCRRRAARRAHLGAEPRNAVPAPYRKEPARLNWKTFFAMLQRDGHVARRNLVVMLQPLLLTFVFGRVLTSSGMMQMGYKNVLLPGIIAIAMVLSGVQAVAMPLIAEFQFTKEIEDRLLAPMENHWLAVEKVVAGMVQ